MTEPAEKNAAWHFDAATGTLTISKKKSQSTHSAISTQMANVSDAEHGRKYRFVRVLLHFLPLRTLTVDQK